MTDALGTSMPTSYRRGDEYLDLAGLKRCMFESLSAKSRRPCSNPTTGRERLPARWRAMRSRLEVEHSDSSTVGDDEICAAGDLLLQNL